MMRLLLLLLIPIVLLACQRQDETYTVTGTIVDPFGAGMPGISIRAGDEWLQTDANGRFQVRYAGSDFLLQVTDTGYHFVPEEVVLPADASPFVIQALYKPDSISAAVVEWLRDRQLANGLLESAENGNVVSLYDQALAALAFMAVGDMDKARRIFDFFDTRVDAELLVSPGGFSQFRDKNGVPGWHRWMGDNAWLLLALQQYQQATGDQRYVRLIAELEKWTVSLQDADGGLWAGFGADNKRLNYKVTEGMIDAFAAVEGYTDFHRRLLSFLDTDRWDSTEKSLMAWVGHPQYQWALDNVSWAYMAFPDYPQSYLDAAQRFQTEQTATVTGNRVDGYDIDEDREVVFMEGTGQMALAFRLAGDRQASDYYLQQMRAAYVASPGNPKAGGFPYATNAGSGYGDTPLWPTAHTVIALSPGVWYLMAQVGFNPLRLGREKKVPGTERFWE